MKKAYFYMFLLCLLTGMSCSSEDDELEGGLHPRRKDAVAAEKTYAVGDFYDVNGIKGVVYKVEDDGRSGMILALEQSVKAYATVTAEVAAKNANDGMSNMALVKTMPDWRRDYPAFAWCDQKNNGLDTEWHIPASSEFQELYRQYTRYPMGINATLAAHGGSRIVDATLYWTSTEIDGARAYAFDFNQGILVQKDKSINYAVRLVRHFDTSMP